MLANHISVECRIYRVAFLMQRQCEVVITYVAGVVTVSHKLPRETRDLSVTDHF